MDIFNNFVLSCFFVLVWLYIGDIVEWIDRIEFQLRGTPHTHSLYAVKRINGSQSHSDNIHSGEAEDVQRVIKTFDTSVCGMLTPRHSDDMSGIPIADDDLVETFLQREKEPDFIPPKDYFPDDMDPRRVPFNGNLDYRRKSEVMTKEEAAEDESLLFCQPCPNTFVSAQVQQQHRNLLLINNVHRCTPTCFKYNVKGVFVCRFDYPRLLRSVGSMIVNDKDRKHRPRTRILPKNNNVRMNPTAVSPLYSIALGGNSDVQWICNKRGAAEYVASYALKPECPDAEKVCHAMKLYVTRMSNRCQVIRARNILNVVANNITSSCQVGGVQVCYFLLNIPVVRIKRNVISLNPSRKENVKCAVITDENKLNEMQDTQSAFKNGPMSQLGRRAAYAAFAKHQVCSHHGNEISYYVLMTNFYIQFEKEDESKDEAVDNDIELQNDLDNDDVFDCEVVVSSRKIKLSEPPKMLMPAYGIILEQGSFKIDKYVFRRFKKGNEAVICMRPHVKVDPSDEMSCFASLLFHCPWDEFGEDGLVAGFDGPVSSLQHKMEKGKIPFYVKNALEDMARSEKLLSNHGVYEVNTGNEICMGDYSDNEDNSSVSDIW